MSQIADDLLLRAALMVSVFPGSQGTVVVLPVQLHRAAINLAQVSHNDSTGIRGLLTAVQESLALHTDIFIPRAASPVLTSLLPLGALLHPFALLQCLQSYNHFHQSFPSDFFFPSSKKSGCCDSGDRHIPDLHKHHISSLCQHEQFTDVIRGKAGP